MADINAVVISGRLTRDPESRDTSSTPITRMCVAVNDRRRNQQTGEWEDYANFFDVVAFGKIAEFAAQDLHKGDAVTVDGKLLWSSWEAEGKKKSKVEINAAVLSYARSAAQGAPRPTTRSALAEATYDEELPF